MYRGLADYNMDVYVQPESRYLSDNAADLHEPLPQRKIFSRTGDQWPVTV